MFGNRHSDRVRQLFEDQFEPDGDGFFYRKNMKGAPIRVSEAERNEFVDAFSRRLRFGLWSVVSATMILIGLVVWQVPDGDSRTGMVFIYVGIGLILSIFLASYFWAWNAPSRALERRPAAGVARSREEMRQLMFSKMTYGQLAVGALAGPLVLLMVSGRTDVLHGWGRLWLLFAGLFSALAGIQALRKWRFERRIG